MTIAWRVCAGLLALGALPVAAQEWPLPAADAQLAATRGGFDTGSGLLASFGIERVVYINGNLAAHTRVSIPDIGHMTTAQAHALAAAGGVLSLDTDGAGHAVAPQPGGATATVVQNRLDGQHIQSLTTLDASVDHLDALRSARLAEALQDAQLNALGH